jgi:hypothetical protein
MIDSSQVMYIARSEKPISPAELNFHMSQHKTVPTALTALKELGYAIVGYTEPNGMCIRDLEGNRIPEGTRPGDLMFQGPHAQILMPKRKERKVD